MALSEKPPSRRHLAHVLAQAVPVVNNHADTIEALKGYAQDADKRLTALEEGFAATLPIALSFAQRLSWLVLGHL